mmetsp:Transcript_57097/g.105571  ORF Transcript_57097/g.105571 Transcript_57097/m.105571 type:complete len:114 (-) Transcript_57097:271-612(-)
MAQAWQGVTSCDPAPQCPCATNPVYGSEALAGRLDVNRVRISGAFFAAALPAAALPAAALVGAALLAAALLAALLAAALLAAFFLGDAAAFASASALILRTSDRSTLRSLSMS